MTKTVGLRTEILITLSILLGAALLFGGLVMLRFTETSLLEERVIHLDSLSRFIAQSLDDVENGQLADKNIKTLSSLPDSINCQGWWHYDQNLGLVGSWFSPKSNNLTPLSIARRQQVKLTGELHRVVNFPTMLNLFNKVPAQVQFIVPIKRNNRFSGLLELSYSLNDIHLKLVKSQKIVIVYIFLYGFVLVLAGYYLLQRNIIKPARSLLQATEDVSHGNLETRLPIAGPTEIAQLSVAYNRMVDALQQSQRETKKQIEILETTNHELQQTRNELIRSEKMASVGQLAAGLAHEVGNPLAALIGYLELLKQRIKSSDEKDIVERSIVETNRIDFLVRELLDFSRPSETITLESIDVVSVLNSCIQLLKNQGAMPNIEIHNELPDSIPVIRIDRNKLQQVFINLLLNAVQSCEQGGKITLSAGDDTGSVWVGISDTGAGIAEADLSKIFDPFFTTKSPGEGTGLGLAICQRIVEEAGGKIEVESYLGEGSRFRVVFPCG